MPKWLVEFMAEAAKEKAKVALAAVFVALESAIVAWSDRLVRMLGPEWTAVLFVLVTAIPASALFVGWVRKSARATALAEWAPQNLRVVLRSVSLIVGDHPRVRALVGVERATGLSPAIAFRRMSVKLNFPTIGYSTERDAIVDPPRVQSGDVVGAWMEWSVPKDQADRLASQSGGGWRHYAQIEECEIESNVATFLTHDGMFPYRVEV